MDTTSITYLLAIFMFVMGFIVTMCMINNYMRLRVNDIELQMISASIMSNNDKISSKYSEDILKYIKMFTTQITVLRFREYSDSHNLSLITRENTKSLVKEIAKEVNDSLNLSIVKFDDVLFTKEFIDGYIISIAIDNVKNLLSGEIDNIELF